MCLYFRNSITDHSISDKLHRITEKKVLLGAANLALRSLHGAATWHV